MQTIERVIHMQQGPPWGFRLVDTFNGSLVVSQVSAGISFKRPLVRHTISFGFVIVLLNLMFLHFLLFALLAIA